MRTLLDVADGPLSPEHLHAAVSEALHRGLVRNRALSAALGGLAPGARLRLTAALEGA